MKDARNRLKFVAGGLLSTVLAVGMFFPPGWNGLCVAALSTSSPSPRWITGYRSSIPLLPMFRLNSDEPKTLLLSYRLNLSPLTLPTTGGQWCGSIFQSVVPLPVTTSQIGFRDVSRSQKTCWVSLSGYLLLSSFSVGFSKMAARHFRRRTTSKSRPSTSATP